MFFVAWKILWITQSQHKEIFEHAFKTRKHMILFDYINNSKAFQCWAHMETLPKKRFSPSMDDCISLGNNAALPYQMKKYDADRVLQIPPSQKKTLRQRISPG